MKRFKKWFERETNENHTVAAVEVCLVALYCGNHYTLMIFDRRNLPAPQVYEIDSANTSGVAHAWVNDVLAPLFYEYCLGRKDPNANRGAKWLNVGRT